MFDQKWLRSNFEKTTAICDEALQCAAMQWTKNVGEVRSTRARAAIVFRVTSIAARRRCLAIIPYCHIIVQTFDSSFAWPVLIRRKNVFYPNGLFFASNHEHVQAQNMRSISFSKKKADKRLYIVSGMCLISFHLICCTYKICWYSWAFKSWVNSFLLGAFSLLYQCVLDTNSFMT